MFGDHLVLSILCAAPVWALPDFHLDLDVFLFEVADGLTHLEVRGGGEGGALVVDHACRDIVGFAVVERYLHVIDNSGELTLAPNAEMRRLMANLTVIRKRRRRSRRSKANL